MHKRKQTYPPPHDLAKQSLFHVLGARPSPMRPMTPATRAACSPQPLICGLSTPLHRLLSIFLANGYKI